MAFSGTTTVTSAGLEAYDTLRLPSTATAADVRRAYRRSALAVHPDRPHGDARKFLQVRRAFELLSDPDIRATAENAAEGASSSSQPCGRTCKQALPAIGSWVEKRRFATQAEACTFVERCQPFDFVPEQTGEEESVCTTFECKDPGCTRRWRVRQTGGGLPWVVEQEGELFASRTNVSAATSAPARETLPCPLFLGVQVSLVPIVLQEGYQSHGRRRGVPCSVTPAKARAAAAGTVIGAAAKNAATAQSRLMRSATSEEASPDGMAELQLPT